MLAAGDWDVTANSTSRPSSLISHVAQKVSSPLMPYTPLPSDNFYGTPKPPAEPSPAAPPLNVSEALLPGARPSAQGKRKRNQSVSNMEQRASLEPPEEEEEESPVVNGNGVAITPGTVQRGKLFPPLMFLTPHFRLFMRRDWSADCLTNAVTMMKCHDFVFMCGESLGCKALDVPWVCCCLDLCKTRQTTVVMAIVTCFSLPVILPPCLQFTLHSLLWRQLQT